MPRMEYFDFMRLLEKSEFVITDGGSNQGELFYMGKPCLILRKKTEQAEGVGSNAVMYNGVLDLIRDFYLHYHDYKAERIADKASPSEMIVDAIQEYIAGKIIRKGGIT